MKKCFVDYYTRVCPYCGGPCKHPYTGLVTEEQLEEDFNSCIIQEIINEAGSTVAYTVQCKKEINVC